MARIARFFRFLPYVLLMAALFAPAPVADAQDRYELGRRSRAFDRAFATADAEGRRRAAEPLDGAVRAFLTMRTSVAGRQLDAARHALVSADPVPSGLAWARSLAVIPATRLLPAATADEPRSLPVEIRELYPSDETPPAGATVELRIGDDDATHPVALDKLESGSPVRTTLPVPVGITGDVPVHVRVAATAGELDSWSFVISIVANLDARLAALQQAAAATGDTRTAPASTLRAHAEWLKQQAAGEPGDTDIFAARMLGRAERLAAGKPLHGPEHPGDFNIVLPIGSDDLPCRLFVPDELDADRPVPLVIAFHGAGGSQHMFFDGYGAGEVVRQCRARGWMCVSPKLGFFSSPDTAALIDALAAHWPIDRRRVFLVGHSMGAAAAITQAQANPDGLAAVAALGGGGRITNARALADRKILVVVGSEDFALGQAQALRDGLRRADAAFLYRQVPGVEHLAIVQLALPGVFSFFDAAAPDEEPDQSDE